MREAELAGNGTLKGVALGCAIVANAVGANATTVQRHAGRQVAGWSVVDDPVGGRCAVSKDGFSVIRERGRDRIDFMRPVDIAKTDSNARIGPARVVTLNDVDGIRVGKDRFKVAARYGKAPNDGGEIRSDDPRAEIGFLSGSTGRPIPASALVALLARSPSASFHVRSELVPSGRTEHVDLAGLGAALKSCPHH